MKIDKTVLAYLLNITQKDAMKKIQSFIAKHELNYKQNSIRSEHVELLSKHVCYDIDFAVKNIRSSYTRSLSTFEYILNYPLHLMVLKKRKIKGYLGQSYPEYIRIPVALRKLLTAEQRKLILEKWQDRHGVQAKIYGIKFK